MNIGEEKAVASLRALYCQYGYSHYKMSKFEEYDLYSRNKEFLISDSVITFTDTNGKLMALKPDVTLSIIKNGRDEDGTQKVYYDEHVYRVSDGTRAFKELKQVGLEHLGRINTYTIYEVLLLAAKSMQALSADCVLDISHLDIVFSLLDELGLSAADTAKALACIGSKNRHELAAICDAAGCCAQKAAVLPELIGLYGAPHTVLPRLQELLQGTAAAPYVGALRTVTEALSHAGLGNMLRLDFSVVSARDYYNGFVFKGFINGISAAVLSGGQYDRLMHKMGRQSGAIGFALYLDLLEELPRTAREYDVDTVLLYKESDSPSAVQAAVSRLIAEGAAVSALSSLPDKLKYRRLFVLDGEDVTENG